MQRYCAYQDRCHKEVRSKLLEIGMYGDDLEDIMATLIEENFLNEERFAKSFARGKFRMNQWGRIRITQELKRRDIFGYCLRKGLEEIEEADYWNTLLEVLLKKSQTVKANNTYQKKQKLAQYAFGRGFEMNLIWEAIKEMEQDGKL